MMLEKQSFACYLSMHSSSHVYLEEEASLWLLAMLQDSSKAIV